MSDCFVHYKNHFRFLFSLYNIATLICCCFDFLLCLSLFLNIYINQLFFCWSPAIFFYQLSGMAQELDDGEFWLPSEFLTDDDLLTDFKTDCSKTKSNDDFSYGFGSSFGFNSVLSSPVESVIGSTETESDEDDFITFLTRKISCTTLQDSHLSSDYPTKGPKLSGSPQSTLCGYKPGSSRGSPNCISRVSSPPRVKDAVGWDLLYAAAGEVARMRVNEESTALYPSKTSRTPLRPCPVSVTRANTDPISGYCPNPKTQAQLSYQQLLATQLQQLSTSGIWGQENLGNLLKNGRRIGDERTQGLSPVAWPTLQQPQQQPQQLPRSGMRAVFLGENGVKKERTGTGVFLPRRYGTNSTENPKKPVGCSTVLLPDRVVHALNLNLDSIDVPLQSLSHSQPRGNANFTPEYDAALKLRHSIALAQQRGNTIRPQPVINQEFWLPQEWTY